MEMDNNHHDQNKREVRSFLMARDPSIDRQFRPRPHKQQRLFNEIRESDESDSSENELSDTESEYEASSTATGDTQSDAESVPQVYLRLRPVKAPSKGYSISDCGKVLIAMNAATENTSNNVNRMEKHFSFTNIFESTVGQRDVYDICVGPRIIDEECATIMTYGTSGSGKTYTLLGDNVRAGIIPRALENIFTMYSLNIYHMPKLKIINQCMVFLEDDAILKEQQIRTKLLEISPDISGQLERLKQVIHGDHTFTPKDMSDVSVMIWVSFVEIYNELVYDLLELPPRQVKIAPPPRRNLKIVGSNGKVFVKGLTRVFVTNAEEALKLLRLGQQRSSCASTAINAKSSRSHCIFSIDILKYHRSGITTQNTYKFCDLAGSERVDKTGTVGSRLKEAQNINTSLMVLGRCLDAASIPSRKKTIPYRDSKLTMFLQSSLLGMEHLSMIVTVTPLEKFYEENLNVLNFASIAQDIVFKKPKKKCNSTRYSGFIDSSVGVSTQNSEYIKSLELEIANLHITIKRLQYETVLKLQLQEEKLRKELTEGHQEILQSSIKLIESLCEKKLASARREYEAEVASLKRKHAAEIEDLKDEMNERRNTSQSGDSSTDVEIIDDE